MTTQLHRQLELNVTALCRGFRQALRFAQKTDPQGTPETSPAWKIVADRQAMLLTMLAAVAPFLHPAMAQATAQLLESPAELPLPIAPEPLIEAANEIPILEKTPLTSDSSDEEFLASLPADIQALHHQIIALAQRPTHSRQDRRRQERELQHLQADLEKRYHKWRDTNLRL